MSRAFSLAIVGADHPNKGKSPTRRFEIALCPPGELVELRREPENPKDERAIAVYSCRGVQLGYITAERAPFVGKLMREAEAEKLPVRAVFQEAADFGAWLRVTFDGSEPVPPPPAARRAPANTLDPGVDPDPDFYPDFVPPED